MRPTCARLQSPPLRRMSDLFIAGRNLEKEIRFKVGYARQKLDEYCRGNWIDIYVATDKKPSSIDYISDHSRFKFVVTSRTTLTPEKIDQLESLGIPIERQYTELKGLRMNYDAIRRHRAGPASQHGRAVQVQRLPNADLHARGRRHRA